jgi:integrase
MLLRRGSTYYLRKSVPVPLRRIVGCSQLWVSLRTKDLEEAKRRLAVEQVKVNRRLQHARQTLQRPEAAVERIAQETAKEWRETFRADDDTDETEKLVLTSELRRLNEKAGDLSLVDQGSIRAYQKLLNGDGDADVTENPPLSTIFERWRHERRPSEKTWREFDRALRGFIDVAGDLPVRSIRKEHVRQCKATWLAAISKRDGKTLKVATVQKLLNGLRAVLEWAAREGYTETNVAHGVSRVAALNGKGVTADDRRLPFSLEQVRTVVEKLPAEGPQRWLWLIGLYSGARLAEIAGLRRDDVREVEGVLCFDVRPHEGRGLKTRASRRLIPVHPELLRAGFTADLLPFKAAGKMASAHYWSKRVNGWLRDVAGITDPQLSFHSARHTVKDRLRAARVPESEQRAVMGHAGSGIADGYGLGFPASVLAEAISKIHYGGKER